jgi:hypothetical protein
MLRVARFALEPVSFLARNRDLKIRLVPNHSRPNGLGRQAGGIVHFTILIRGVMRRIRGTAIHSSGKSLERRRRKSPRPTGWLTRGSQARVEKHFSGWLAAPREERTIKDPPTHSQDHAGLRVSIQEVLVRAADGCIAATSGKEEKESSRLHKKLKRRIYHSAAKASFTPIFLPCSYVLPWYEMGTS